MPQRFLRPGITNSERWNSVSWQAQSFYIRILTLVDDFGQYDARPAVLWGQCFQIYNGCQPNSQCRLNQIPDLLQQLAASKLIELYEVDGKQFLQVSQWQERIREGCKRKYPNPEKLQQVAASCSVLLPPSSPSPPSSPPTPSPLVVSVEPPPASATTDLDWLTGLKADSGYSGLDIDVEYARMKRWCEVHKKQPTRRRFINWLNRCDKPMSGQDSTTGKPATNGPLAPSQVVLYSKELERVEAKIASIRNTYSGMQTWSDEDRAESKRLKARRDELKKLLGVSV